MKQGALIFDETADRYDIRFDLADYYGGLHCGECMEVFAGGKWKPTRICSRAANGNRPALSTGKIGILWVSAPRT